MSASELLMLFLIFLSGNYIGYLSGKDSGYWQGFNDCRRQQESELREERE